MSSEFTDLIYITCELERFNWHQNWKRHIRPFEDKHKTDFMFAFFLWLLIEKYQQLYGGKRMQECKSVGWNIIDRMIDSLYILLFQRKDRANTLGNSSPDRTIDPDLLFIGFFVVQDMTSVSSWGDEIWSASITRYPFLRTKNLEKGWQASISPSHRWPLLQDDIKWSDIRCYPEDWKVCAWWRHLAMQAWVEGAGDTYGK